MKFDWKFFVTLIATIAGLAVPVWLWQFDLKAKSLTVRLNASVPLHSQEVTSIPDLQISIGGERIESPVISTLEISNDGEKPIPTSDFESDIELQVGKLTKLVRARVSEVDPEDLKATISVDGQSVRLKPLLLNPKDKITVAILTSGEIPTFIPRSRVAGIPSIKFDGQKSVDSKWKQIAFNGFLSLAGLTLYFYFGTTLLNLSSTKIPQNLALSSMAVLAPLSALAALRVYEAAELSTKFANLLPVIAIIFTIGGVMNYRVIQTRRNGIPSAR